MREKIVIAAINGDDDAFVELMESVKADIYRIAFSFVKEEQLAIDVLQEVTYRAYKNIHSLKEPAYAKTWLIRIAMNYSRDLLRKMEREVIINDPDIFGKYEEDFTAFEVGELLGKMENEAKEWLILKYVYDATFKEMASLFDLPESTVKTRIYRYVKMMRDLIEEEDGMHA